MSRMLILVILVSVEESRKVKLMTESGEERARKGRKVTGLSATGS